MVPVSFAPFDLAGEEFALTRSGALYWPREGALLVADLHLEKGSWYAQHGALLPPYDSRETLERLAEIGGETVLLQSNDRAPQHLYPKLSERGYEYDTVETDDGVVTVVWKANQAANEARAAGIGTAHQINGRQREVGIGHDHTEGAAPAQGIAIIGRQVLRVVWRNGIQSGFD